VAWTQGTASTKVTLTPETQSARAASCTGQGTSAASSTAQGITTDASTSEGTRAASEGPTADARQSAADIFGPKGPPKPDTIASKGESTQHSTYSSKSSPHTSASS
jgi:hypothetical protein